MNQCLQILGQVPFLAGLSQAEPEMINRLFREVDYGPNETICFAGDPAARLFVMADGRVKLNSQFPAREKRTARHVDPGFLHHEDNDSIWLREGTHHVLRSLHDRGVECKAIEKTLRALEGIEPVIEVPWAAAEVLKHLPM